MNETARDARPHPVAACGICGRRLVWPGWDQWAECQCGMQVKWESGGQRVMRPIQWHNAPPRGEPTWRRVS